MATHSVTSSDYCLASPEGWSILLQSKETGLPSTELTVDICVPQPDPNRPILPTELCEQIIDCIVFDPFPTLTTDNLIERKTLQACSLTCRATVLSL